jgi:hypothetical protein
LGSKKLRSTKADLPAVSFTVMQTTIDVSRETPRTAVSRETADTLRGPTALISQ